MRSDEAWRSKRIKLIPRVVEGAWMVKRAVGTKPAIIGTKLKHRYFDGDGYSEVDVDVGSSAMAVGVLKVVKGYAKMLVLDMAFVLQGDEEDELPERIFGAVRVHRVDLTKGLNVEL